MAIRRPIYLFADATLTPITSDFYEYNDSFMADIVSFASYVHAQDPGSKLEVNTSNGTQMPNQAFTDTYYIAGAVSTRVERFSTAAETPNVSMSTDTYNRIRIVDNQGTLPTTDANNLEYPLYLTADTPRQLRAMTRQDFIDTFVTPALDNWLGAVANEQGGTYFLTTSANPANATIVGSVPAAVNSVANLSAYSSGGIGEAVKQTTDINYWLAKVDYSEIDFDPVEDSLPMYFDAGTETIRMHTLASWTALLGPFLRYYLGGGSPTHTISYNINGGGTTQGSIFTDSRRTPTGTGYTTRFVNANDYRTQEFPTGTESTIAGTEKRLKMQIGVSEVISLLGTSAAPQSFDSSGPIVVTSGTRSPTSGQDYNSSTDYWEVISGTPLNADDGSGSFSGGGRVTIRRNNVTVYNVTYTLEADALAETSITIGTVTYNKGTIELDNPYQDQFGIYTVTGSYLAQNGFTFTTAGNIEEKDYFYDGAQQTFSTSEWCNVAPTGNYWVRFTDDTAATSGGTSRVPATGQNFTETGATATYWRILQDFYGVWTDLTIVDNGTQVYYQRFTGPNRQTNASALTSKYVGDKQYFRGTQESSYSYTVNYGIYYTQQTSTRVTANTGSSFGTWLAMTSNRSIYWNDTSASGSYASRFMQVKVEISDDAAGSNILDTGYYRTSWHGDQVVSAQLPSTMSAISESNGLSGSCSAQMTWAGSTGTVNCSGFGNPGSGTGTVNWLSAGATASDYEVRFSYTVSLTGNGSTTGSYTNTSSTAGLTTSGAWYPAENAHQWKVNDSGTPSTNSSIIGTLQIREQSTGTVLATSNVSLSANNDP
tara:strand:+ start:16245 stop:18716 length:2472 start_codon:yes stop_codon:yes gene_type:complete